MTFASQIEAAFVPIASEYGDANTTRALTWAESFVQTYCDQQFDLAEDVTVYLDPKPYGQALLPQVPVAEVNSVQGWLPQAGGGMGWTTLTNYKFVAETGLIYNTTGEPGTTWYVTGPSWPWLPGSLQVNYNYGYESVPQPLVDVACRLAQQYLENPTGQLQRRTGDIEDRFGGSQGVVVNELDRMILDRYTWVRIA
jgi:hypothetical protein